MAIGFMTKKPVSGGVAPTVAAHYLASDTATTTQIIPIGTAQAGDILLAIGLADILAGNPTLVGTGAGVGGSWTNLQPGSTMLGNSNYKAIVSYLTCTAGDATFHSDNAVFAAGVLIRGATVVESKLMSDGGSSPRTVTPTLATAYSLIIGFGISAVVDGYAGTQNMVGLTVLEDDTEPVDDYSDGSDFQMSVWKWAPGTTTPGAINFTDDSLYLAGITSILVPFH